MKRYIILTCIVLLMLAGCNTPGVNAPTPPNGSENQAPPALQKEIFPLVSIAPENPFLGSPPSRGPLADGIVAELMVNVQTAGFAPKSDPKSRVLEPLNRDGYLMEIIVNKQFTVDGLPRVESEIWRLDETSGKKWMTVDRMTGYQFKVVIDEAVKPTLSPSEPLEVPIRITLPGVKKDGQPVPVEFEFETLDEANPSSKYGLVLEGRIIDDSLCWEPKPDWINKNLELVVCSIRGDEGSDFANHIVSLYDVEKAQIRFVVDIKFPAYYMLWAGWLNDQKFFIATNYSLLVFNTDGVKREILRINETPNIAIHGLAWSRATQTMAVICGTGRADEMELRLMTDHLNTVKTIAVVDHQWPLSGFIRQMTRMAWDDRGERLAFTKNRDMNMAVYDTRTGKFEDVPGVRRVARIDYDPKTKEFVTSDQW